MKTIEEIKNEVAQRHGFDAWDLYEFDRQNGCKINILIDECMQEHAKQVAEAQRQSDVDSVNNSLNFNSDAYNITFDMYGKKLVTDNI